MKQKHNFHLVTESPWPLFVSSAALLTPVGAVMYFHHFKYGLFFLLFGLFSVVYFATLWWRDVIREGTFLGDHTTVVQKGLRYGMFLFILSEVMFFFAFFWGFFHFGLGQSVELGCCWPPKFIKDMLPENFTPWGIPLLNTAILVLSGASITWAHYALLDEEKETTYEEQVELLSSPMDLWDNIRRSKAVRHKNEVLLALDLTLVLAVAFTLLQIYEYSHFSFNISDGVWGSIFYMATGFHGFHVFIGSVFITVTACRILQDQLTPRHHFGFEAAAWYWHFVDVVWLFLFISIYWWGTGNLI